MHRIRPLLIAAAVAACLAARFSFFAPLAEPDNSALRTAPLWAAPSPAPPPPWPTRPPRPPDWTPPAWPLSLGRPSRPPDFAVTAWTFPNTREVLDFYWNAPAYASSRTFVGTPARLRQLARAWGFRLAESCPDEAVSAYVRDLSTSYDPVLAPVLLHRVLVNGFPMWVLVVAWEYPAEDPALGLGHIQIHVLDPSSGSVLDRDTCA